MVKGITRQILLVDSPDPRLFERAIFILRDGRDASSSDELLLEAQRIADSYLRENVSVRKLRLGPVLYTAAGASLTGLVWLAVSLL